MGSLKVENKNVQRATALVKPRVLKKHPKEDIEFIKREFNSVEFKENLQETIEYHLYNF